MQNNLEELIILNESAENPFGDVCDHSHRISFEVLGCSTLIRRIKIKLKLQIPLISNNEESHHF